MMNEMMNINRGFLSKLAVFIIFSILGSGIGFAVTGFLVNLDSLGGLVQWKLLDSPLKFQQFVYANESEIWGFAENGLFYMYKSDFCNDTPGETCGQWLELDPHGEFDPNMKSLIRSGCEAVYDYYSVESRYPPQTESSPTECVITKSQHPIFGITSLTYYVLLDNGTVWTWKHKIAFEKHSAVSFPLIGLIIGIITWFIFHKKFANFIDRHLGVNL